MSSVFYSLSEHILIELDFTQVQINNVDFPLEIVSDGNADTRSLVNTKNGTLITNNVKDTSFVSDPLGRKIILDDDTAYYYPNFDSNITVAPIIPVNISLKYITVRLHMLAGYTFQDGEGFTLSLSTKDTDDKMVNLVSQSFLKSEINRYKYNITPKKIGSLHYDKFLEFLAIDFADVIDGGVNEAFFNGIIDFSRNSILYASLTTIKDVDFSKGYAILGDEDNKRISFPPRDEFDLLTASIQEDPNKYLIYSAKYDGAPIENFIFSLNSVSGNAYYIIHEIQVYEQRGLSLLLVDEISQIQNSDFDVSKRLRPIVSRFADGGLKIVYSVRLFNAAAGDSIFKSSELAINDITAYQEEIGKINIQQIENPIKVYNKIDNRELAFDKKDSVLNQILVPMYINAFNVILEEDFFLNVVPFDNIYEIKIFKLVDGERSVYNIQPNVFHKMVFVKENGNNITIDEIVDDAKRKYGILTFQISKENAGLIKGNSIDSFYLNTETNNIETTLSSGTINYQ